MFIIVTIKLIAPRIDETPAKWREKIAKSTEPPEWAWIPARGGYTVHPVPTPASTKEEDTRRINEGGNNKIKNWIFLKTNYIIINFNLLVNRVVIF